MMALWACLWVHAGARAGRYPTAPWSLDLKHRSATDLELT